MNLKPIYDTGTITFVDVPKSISLKEIDVSYVKDPKGIIPNGIFKVFKNEKNRLLFLSIFNLLIVFSSLTLSSLFLTIYKNEINWFWNVPIFLTFGLSLTKLVFLLLELRGLKGSINLYRESIQAGSRLTPPFISAMYIKLYKKQVGQNWIVISFLFYGTIITLLFWWLKDVNWWVFTFKDWINSLSNGEPGWIGGTMIFVLIVVLLLHIYLTIFRKKRIIDIQSFFGNEVVSQIEINTIVEQKNKFYKKIFFLSILIILVFPIIARIIYKKVKK